MTIQYIYLIIFFCLGYLIVTDESISKAVFFISQLIKNKLSIIRWWLFNSPQNPIVKYQMHKRSMKLAEELMKEYKDKQ